MPQRIPIASGQTLNRLSRPRESGRIPIDVKHRPLPFMCCSLALFIGGCPARQTPWRVVYVPAQTPAPVETTDTPAQFMTIEEPAPPEPPPAPPPEEPAVPKPEHRSHRVMRSEPPASSVGNEIDAAEPQVSSPVPSLEPRESYAEEAALRHQVQGLQDDVRQRIAKLSGASLSGADRKTLDDARTFFLQSADAVKEGDLQRALNLARKASLLVLALER